MFEELEYQDERLEKVGTLIDQHYEIEITSIGLDKLSTIRFRCSGTWSRNLNIPEIDREARNVNLRVH